MQGDITELNSLRARLATAESDAFEWKLKFYKTQLPNEPEVEIHLKLQDMEQALSKLETQRETYANKMLEIETDKRLTIRDAELSKKKNAMIDQIRVKRNEIDGKITRLKTNRMRLRKQLRKWDEIPNDVRQRILQEQEPSKKRLRTDCVICFRKATLTCENCKTMSYCSSACASRDADVHTLCGW